MPFRRDLFSGELVEYKTEGEEGGRQIIARTHVPEHMTQEKTCHGAWNRPWVSDAIGVDKSQIKQFNEGAHAAGTGARYNEDGDCVCDTREIRNKELRRRGYMDRDAGFGDFCDLSGDFDERHMHGLDD